MKIILSLLLCTVFSFAKEFIYFLPKDSAALQKHIEKLIKTSQSNIDIAMYNFGHKGFSKLLNKSVKNGVDVSVVFDEKKVKTDKKSRYNYLKEKGVNCFIANKKMHIKMAIFDDKTVMIGSLNWSEASFEDNYEIIYITDDKKVVNKSKKIFIDLKKYSKK